MNQIENATKVKNNFGNILMNAMKKPVFIEKNKKLIAVLLSFDDYQKLEKTANKKECNVLKKMPVSMQSESNLTSEERDALIEKMEKVLEYSRNK